MWVDCWTAWMTPTRDWLMTEVGPPDWPMTALAVALLMVMTCGSQGPPRRIRRRRGRKSDDREQGDWIKRRCSFNGPACGARSRGDARRRAPQAGPLNDQHLAAAESTIWRHTITHRRTFMRLRLSLAGLIIVSIFSGFATGADAPKPPALPPGVKAERDIEYIAG